MILLLTVACAPQPPVSHVVAGLPDTVEQVPTEEDPSQTMEDSAATDTGEELAEPEDTATPTSPCPEEMALVADRFCIDRYEASLEERRDGDWVPASPYQTIDDRSVRATVDAGQVPQGYISGLEAAAACAAAGKRLCTSEEWLTACRGPAQTRFPYGDTQQSGACNDRYAGGHPVVDFFGTGDGVWDGVHMNDPGINQQADTVAPSGAYPDCVSAWGVYDMHGNLHEWVADSDGTFRGGFYADAAINGAGCTYVTTAHTTTYHDYSTGFRCCAALR